METTHRELYRARKTGAEYLRLFETARSNAMEMRELLVQLSLLCPSDEGLGGHAPIGAFIELGSKAREILRRID